MTSVSRTITTGILRYFGLYLLTYFFYNRRRKYSTDSANVANNLMEINAIPAIKFWNAPSARCLWKVWCCGVSVARMVVIFHIYQLGLKIILNVRLVAVIIALVSWKRWHNRHHLHIHEIIIFFCGGGN